MSKFGGRPGHNEKCRGAKAIVDEVTEDRPIFFASKKYLEQKNEFVDCTPYHNPASQNEDLNYGINMANKNNVDLYYSTHLNKSKEYFEGEIGAEVWVHDRNSTKAIAAATRVLKNLKDLGFKNRGIKYMKEEKRQLGELMHTNMEAMIIECFFVEATKDVELYNKVGADAIGFAIANGIDPRVLKEEIKENGDDEMNGIITVSAELKQGDYNASTTLSNISAGQKVKIINKVGNWVKISVWGVEGYVYSSYVDTLDSLYEKYKNLR